MRFERQTSFTRSGMLQKELQKGQVTPPLLQNHSANLEVKELRETIFILEKKLAKVAVFRGFSWHFLQSLPLCDRDAFHSRYKSLSADLICCIYASCVQQASSSNTSLSTLSEQRLVICEQDLQRMKQLKEAAKLEVKQLQVEGSEQRLAIQELRADMAKKVVILQIASILEDLFAGCLYSLKYSRC